MNLTIIEKKELQKIIKQELIEVKELLHAVLKQQKEKDIPKEGGFISIASAMLKYGTSRTTISKKAKKYKIERLQVGKQNLLKESDLVFAFKHKEPKPLFLKKSFKYSEKPTWSSAMEKDIDTPKEGKEKPAKGKTQNFN